MRTIAICVSIGLARVCCAQQPGELDTSFADQGKLLLSFPTPGPSRCLVAIDGSDRPLLACGWSFTDSLYLYRYGRTGIIDSSFAVDGKLKTRSTGPVRSIAARDDGHIVVVSEGQTMLVDSMGVIITDQFMDGALTGLLLSSNWMIADAEQDAYGITLLVDTANSARFLVHFNSDGTVDAGFGSQGMVQLTTPFDLYWTPLMITPVNGGVGVAWMTTGCSPCFSGLSLRREIYQLNGSLIEVFMDQATSGSSVGSLGAFHGNTLGTLLCQGQRWGVTWIDNLFFDRDSTTYRALFFDDMVDVSLGPIGSDALGNFYVAGTNSVDDGWSIHRYRDDGTPDPLFDNDLGGVYQNWDYVQTDFISGRQAVPQSVESQGDGRLIVGGTTNDGNLSFIVVARYHSIPDPRAKLDLRLFLGGCWDPNTVLMHDSLRVQGLIPLQQPYPAPDFMPANGVGAGMTSASVLDESGPEAAVDWVWLDLLSAADTATVVATRVGLVRRNGRVTSPINHDPIDFSVGAGSYFLRVRHRNHLGVTLSVPLALSDSVVAVDLTDPATATFGVQAQQESHGVHMLWPGDATGDGLVRYAGADNDRDAVLVAIGGTPPTAITPGYLPADVNLDGVAKYAGADNDRDLILQTIGGVQPTAVRMEQRP